MFDAIRLVVLIGMVGAAGCAQAMSGDAESGDGTGVRARGSGTVLTGESLNRQGGTVLRAMVGKIPNLKVSFMGQARCPSIVLRSAQEIHGRNFPDVYVDGTRATDTCILQSLQAKDVEQVEVYPTGFTTRPGYSGNAQGLILVFTRQ